MSLVASGLPGLGSGVEQIVFILSSLLKRQKGPLAAISNVVSEWAVMVALGLKMRFTT